MELKRMRGWVYYVLMVRSGRCCTRTRAQLTHLAHLAHLTHPAHHSR
jgi:hypothetical protein